MLALGKGIGVFKPIGDPNLGTKHIERRICYELVEAHSGKQKIDMHTKYNSLWKYFWG